MKGYPKYKLSKIVWYPEIPENWDYCKVKHIANTYAGGTPSTVVDSFWNNGDIPWLPSGKLQNCEITSAEKFITQEGLNGSSTKWIKPNTVLVALTGATCANIGYLTFKACANQSVIAVDENPEKANSRFLYYMFLNMRSQILTHQTGGAQAGINDSDVKNLYLLKPSLGEQTQIAAYLDYKTNLIDTTIEKKKCLIELLKEKRQAVINEAVTKGLDLNVPMKDSGVEWLGEIPSNWEVVLMKRIIQDIKDGTHGTHERVIEGKPLLSAKNVFDNKLIINELESKISEEEHNKIVSNGFPKKNDILLSCVGTIGRSYVYDLDYPIAFQRSVAFLRLKRDKVIPKYIKLMIESNLYQSQLMSFAKTSAQSGVYLGDIMKTIIVIPIISDQQKIVDFLDIQLYKIDNILLKIETAIEKLQEYRQSLISEAVTGKIDVRDWQPSKNT